MEYNEKFIIGSTTMSAYSVSHVLHTDSIQYKSTFIRKRDLFCNKIELVTQNLLNENVE